MRLRIKENYRKTAADETRHGELGFLLMTRISHIQRWTLLVCVSKALDVP